MASSGAYTDDPAWARAMDEADPLRGFRGRFRLPAGGRGAYFCGNSLGLQPRDVPEAVRRELDDWAELAVDAHFRGAHPWFRYHEPFREPMAAIVGAEPGEVVMMNGLTANLHLMLVSFYRPRGERRRILIEENAFPSDVYAVQTQLAWRGLDPATDLVVARARAGEATLRTEDVEARIREEGERLALVLLGGVNFHSGQRFDLERIVAAAHGVGATAGFDLAHAAGNVPLELHDWNADFAVWCTYKYLNAGPGAVAGCFVHRRHGESAALPRFGGWWGNDPDTRFRMQLEDRFVPAAGADGWQLSNPPVLALAPLRSSLALFHEAGLSALRAKSERLTGYLEFLVHDLDDPRIRSITPRDPAARGCQLSLKISGEARDLFDHLQREGVVGDFRPPDVIRLAPVPLYNRFEDVWRAGRAMRAWAGQGRHDA